MDSRGGPKLKPLLRITKPVKAVVYRAKVKPYGSLKYLDLRALARARKAEVEIGVLETPAGSPTVVAEIKNGQVVRFGPKECSNCLKNHGKVKLAKLREVIAQTGRLKGGVTLPIPVARTFGSTGLRIPIGPIVIVIGEPDETFCIEWTTTDGTICWWCLFDQSGCMSMGPPQ